MAKRTPREDVTAVWHILHSPSNLTISWAKEMVRFAIEKLEVGLGAVLPLELGIVLPLEPEKDSGGSSQAAVVKGSNRQDQLPLEL